MSLSSSLLLENRSIVRRRVWKRGIKSRTFNSGGFYFRHSDLISPVSLFSSFAHDDQNADELKPERKAARKLRTDLNRIISACVSQFCVRTRREINLISIRRRQLHHRGCSNDLRDNFNFRWIKGAATLCRNESAR
jgi:hypothetical protein